MPYHKNKSNFSDVSILILPNEILYIIFEEFDVPSLISLSNVCNLFKEIARIYLAIAFKNENLSLLLGFEQEHKWYFNVDFVFDGICKKNGNFVFKPRQETPLKFFNSSVLNNPTLWRVLLNTSKEHHHLDETNNSSPMAGPSGTNTNMLQKSCKLSVKTPNSICQKTKVVYRVGNGSSHLKVPYKFSYSVTESAQKTRAGERWIVPQSFECPSSFFYPNEAIAHRIVMSIIKYKSTKKSTTEIISIKGKERVTSLPQPQEVIITQGEPPRKPSRWMSGARGSYKKSSSR
ncbi:10433_t:CDS:1 [Acaulospora colombiana]|uniref:10433_t:CDS:1 n=1 Tax=Acaulospora colombiana TaxID=27376 RepID=A0ACA9M0P6_9GLOM|nr:10433_t:CDS:1 [Acaulospora colombiana]